MQGGATLGDAGRQAASTVVLALRPLHRPDASPPHPVNALGTKIFGVGGPETMVDIQPFLCLLLFYILNYDFLNIYLLFFSAVCHPESLLVRMAAV